jgi:hypothetical protein
LRIGSLTAVMRAESKRERVRSWERRKWLLPPKEEDQGKWCKAAAVAGGQASLVRVKPKTGSRGKYKAESQRQAGRRSVARRYTVQPRRNFYNG